MIIDHTGEKWSLIIQEKNEIWLFFVCAEKTKSALQMLRPPCKGSVPKNKYIYSARVNDDETPRLHAL